MTTISRLDGLERQVKRQAASTDAAGWYEFRVSPTCPPSTSLYIRAGWVQRGPFFVAQEAVYFPSLTLDFSSPAQFGAATYTGNFTTAYAYLALLISYRSEYFIALRDGTPGVEQLRALLDMHGIRAE